MVCFFWAKSSIFIFMFPLRCCRGSFSTSFFTFGEENETYQQVISGQEQLHLMLLKSWTSGNAQIYQRKELPANQLLLFQTLRLSWKKQMQETSFPSSCPHFYLLLHLLQLLQEFYMVPLLLQANALGLLPPAQPVILFHLLNLLLLLPFEVFQFSVIELLLCLYGKGTEINFTLLSSLFLSKTLKKKKKGKPRRVEMSLQRLRLFTKHRGEKFSSNISQSTQGKASSSTSSKHL